MPGTERNRFCQGFAKREQTVLFFYPCNSHFRACGLILWEEKWWWITCHLCTHILRFFLFFSPKSSIQNLFQDITGPFALWEPFLWHLKCYLGLQMFQDLLKQLYVFEFNTSEKTIVSTWISLSRTKQTFWWEHYSYTLQLRCTRHCQCCSIALHVLCMLSNCSPNKSEACSEVNACQALYAAFLFRGWESFQRPRTARMWPNFASRSQKSGPERSG